MIRKYNDYLLKEKSTIKSALKQLDFLANDAILFIVDDNEKLVGSLTDGDVRRGLIEGALIDQSVVNIMQKNPRYIEKSNYDLKKILELRNKNFKIFPVIDKNGIVINVINFKILKSYLPIDVVIMAGGKGTRLKPLTNNIPKPLLLVGDKTIMEHNIDRLSKFGIDDMWVTINYLGKQIQNYFKNGKNKNISIHYVCEDTPLGTIGSVSKIHNFVHDDILVTNSDILTNMDYEKFYLNFKETNADLSIVAIPYSVNIPYAVLEKNNEGTVNSINEKPTYTYHSNGGIYLIKRSLLSMIPKNTFFNATDLIEKLISKNKKVISYSLSSYWLDIGKHEDYKKAQSEINNIDLS